MPCFNLAFYLVVKSPSMFSSPQAYSQNPLYLFANLHMHSSAAKVIPMLRAQVVKCKYETFPSNRTKWNIHTRPVKPLDTIYAVDSENRKAEIYLLSFVYCNIRGTELLSTVKMSSQYPYFPFPLLPIVERKTEHFQTEDAITAFFLPPGQSFSEMQIELQALYLCVYLLLPLQALQNCKYSFVD